MDGWLWFGYWVITFLGLLWVKRATCEKLRCNVFSAAIAAAIFIGMNLAFTYFILVIVYQPGSDVLSLVCFLFLGFGLVPLASAMTLFLGKMLIPFFKVETADIMFCTKYLTTWTFVAFVIVSVLQMLGFFLLFILFGGRVPRSITRVSDDEYYY